MARHAPMDDDANPQEPLLPWLGEWHAVMNQVSI